MRLRLAWVGKTKHPAVRSLTDEYLQRLGRYVAVDRIEAASESALMQQLARSSDMPFLVLLDSRGQQMTSEELAQFLETHQNRGTQVVVFAIGPADGFSEEALSLASLRLSLGKMTLAHEIARIVLVEQLYRAFTILKKHPYHLGH